MNNNVIVAIFSDDRCSKAMKEAMNTDHPDFEEIHRILRSSTDIAYDHDTVYPWRVICYSSKESYLLTYKNIKTNKKYILIEPIYDDAQSKAIIQALLMIFHIPYKIVKPLPVEIDTNYSRCIKGLKWSVEEARTMIYDNFACLIMSYDSSIYMVVKFDYSEVDKLKNYLDNLKLPYNIVTPEGKLL